MYYTYWFHFSATNLHEIALLTRLTNNLKFSLLFLPNHSTRRSLIALCSVPLVVVVVVCIRVPLTCSNLLIVLLTRHGVYVLSIVPTVAVACLSLSAPSLTVPHGDVLLCSMGDVRVVVLCYIFRHLVCPAYATYVALCNLRHNLQLATRRRALAQAVGLRKVQLGAFINLCAFRLP